MLMEGDRLLVRASTLPPIFEGVQNAISFSLEKA